MRGSQWYVLSVGLIILGFFLLNYGAYSLLSGNEAGWIRAGIYGAFGQTSIGLGFIFGICGWIESRAEKRGKR